MVEREANAADGRRCNVGDDNGEKSSPRRIPAVSASNFQLDASPAISSTAQQERKSNRGGGMRNSKRATFEERVVNGRISKL